MSYTQSRENIIPELLAGIKNSHYKIACQLRSVFPKAAHAFYEAYKYVERITNYDEKLKIIDELNRIEDELTINECEGLKALSKLNIYICFESKFKNYSSDYSCICYEHDKEFLLKYIKEREGWYREVDVFFENFIDRGETQALATMARYGEEVFIKEHTEWLLWLVENNIILDDRDLSRIRCSLEVYTHYLEEKVGLDQIVMENLFAVGNLWERICYKIAKLKYPDILCSEHNQTELANGKIPDIIPNTNIVRNKKGVISAADIIIECKKSLYFLQTNRNTGVPDINITNVTKFYKRYCSELQYWILENRPDNELECNDGIKCFFYEDFIEDSSIPLNLKSEIESLKSVNLNKKELFKDLLTDEINQWLIKMNDLKCYLEKLREGDYLSVKTNDSIPIMARLYRHNTDPSGCLKVSIKNTSDKFCDLNCLMLSAVNLSPRSYLEMRLEKEFQEDLTGIAPGEIRTFTLTLPDNFKNQWVTIRIGKEFKNVKAEGEILDYLRKQLPDMTIEEGANSSFMQECNFSIEYI